MAAVPLSTLLSDANVSNGTIFKSILASKDMTWDYFLQNIWEKQPYHFPSSQQLNLTGSSPSTSQSTLTWRDQYMMQHPWEEMVHQGWNIMSRSIRNTINNKVGNSS